MRPALLSIIIMTNCLLLGQNPEGFNAMIEKIVSGTVPYISAEQLATMKAKDFIILDTREVAEYDVSHIDGSLNVGYDNVDLTILQNVPLDKIIVTYCSIGYRSEQVAMQIFSAGFEHVFNLRGGLFSWVNNGYDTVGNCDSCVHGFDEDWSRWINRSKAKVVLEKSVITD